MEASWLQLFLPSSALARRQHPPSTPLWYLLLSCYRLELQCFLSLFGLFARYQFFRSTLHNNIIWVANNYCCSQIIQQRRLFHVNHSWTTNKQSLFKFSSTEKKLLVIFFYYILLSVLALVGFTLSASTIENDTDAVIHYFTCEARGIDPDNPCHKPTANFKFGDLTSFSSYILLGLFPAVNLIYIVDVKELKTFLSNIYSQCISAN